MCHCHILSGKVTNAVSRLELEKECWGWGWSIKDGCNSCSYFSILFLSMFLLKTSYKNRRSISTAISSFALLSLFFHEAPGTQLSRKSPFFPPPPPLLVINSNALQRRRRRRKRKIRKGEGSSIGSRSPCVVVVVYTLGTGTPYGPPPPKKPLLLHFQFPL